MGAGRGSGADHDVELIVLEGRVEFLFHDGLEAMDFVEEEDLFGLEVGEDGGHVALDLEGRAGGLLEANVELVGDDGGQRGFTEPGRSEKENVVEGFAASLGGFERDGQLLLGLGLADEFGKALGAEFELDQVIVVVDAAGGDVAVGLGRTGRRGGEADFSLLLEIHPQARIRRSGR